MRKDCKYRVTAFNNLNLSVYEQNDTEQRHFASKVEAIKWGKGFKFARITTWDGSSWVAVWTTARY